MFKLKDEVVYPGHGVATIEEIVEKRVNQQIKVFFKLKFKYKDVTILVPKEKLENSGVRFVSNQDEVVGALSELAKSLDGAKKYRDTMAGGWSKRQKEYQLKLESGNLKDVAVAYRDLHRYSEVKALSFGEKGLLEMAEDLLVQEMLAATHLDKKEVLEKIRSSLTPG